MLSIIGEQSFLALYHCSSNKVRLLEGILNNCTSDGVRTAFVAMVRVAKLLVCCLAVLSHTADAQSSAFYGEQFAREGSVWLDSHPGLAPPRSALTADELLAESAYLKKLDEIELAGGPYTNALGEPLLDLARNYSKRGEHDAALQLYRRALHIVRINDGLYSARQQPVVRDILDSLRALGDLKALDDSYGYFFRLYGNGEPPLTELRLRAALEYLRWQREALRLELDGENKRRLLKLVQLNERLLETTWADPSHRLQDQWHLTISQLRNLYLVQSRVVFAMALSGTSTGGSIASASALGKQIDFDQRRLESIKRGIVSRGQRLLEQFIAASAGDKVDLSVEQRTRAVLELADWYQWHGKFGEAGRHYEAVVRMLARAGESALLQAWFGNPVELPDNGAYWQPPDLPEDGHYAVAEAIFNVTSRGRATGISVSARRPEDQVLVSRLRRKLASTRFRPRYSDGRAVSTEKLMREYELYN